MKKSLLIVCLCLQYALACAAAQDHAAIRASVDAFVQQHTATRSGKVSYQVEEIDRRLVLPLCTELQTFLPTGARLMGKTAVGVRCAESSNWSIFVPVQVKISQALLVNARQLPAGHILQESDLTTQTMEVTQTGGMTDPNQALGKVLRYGLGAGQVLREDMLRAQFSVTQGQTVQLVVQGPSFSIRSTGVALNNASEGQVAKVKNIGGGVVSGVAHASGVVELSP